MGCCASTAAPSTAGAPPNSASPPRAGKPSNPLVFATKPSKPIGDENIPPNRRVMFGIAYPEQTGAQSVHMFFDKEKPVERVISAAAAHAGLKVDRGKLAGSPEKLNLFTLDGDVVRLDLEIEAHLGSTLHAGDVLVLEKGNQLDPARAQAIRNAKK
jgi:hypothetical protein